jgi:hypothetical protein
MILQLDLDLNVLPLHAVPLQSLSPTSLSLFSESLCHNPFFPQMHYSYVNSLQRLNFNTLCSWRLHLGTIFSSIFRVVLNLVPPCLKLSAFASLLQIIVLCLLLPSQIIAVPLLDARQLLK